MRFSHIRLVRALGAAVLLLCAGRLGSAFGGNPYQVIFKRNAFHLKPPAASHVSAPHEPLPNVRLTGITTILPGKRALLMVDFPTKPREKAKEESYILSEGQRAGSIEVVSIDEKTAHVLVDESGTITNLTFEKIAPVSKPVTIQPVYRSNGQPYRRVFR